MSLKVNGRKEQWQVVGIFQFVGQEGILAYAPLEYISQVNDLANQSTLFRIETAQHDRAYQDKMAETLDHYFRAKGFDVLQSQAGLASLDNASQSLDTLVTFLLIMALLTATVGSMGLAGTMGMNVLERTREIGIMRAIGAVDSIIMRTVIAEGYGHRLDLIRSCHPIIFSIYLFALVYRQPGSLSNTHPNRVYLYRLFDLAGLDPGAVRGGEHPAGAQRRAADDPRGAGL